MTFLLAKTCLTVFQHHCIYTSFDFLLRDFPSPILRLNDLSWVVRIAAIQVHRTDAIPGRYYLRTPHPPLKNKVQSFMQPTLMGPYSMYINIHICTVICLGLYTVQCVLKYSPPTYGHRKSYLVAHAHYMHIIIFLKSAWRHSVYYYYDKARNTPYFASWHFGDSLGVYRWPQCRYKRRFCKSHSRLSKITTGNRCRNMRTMQNVTNRNLKDRNKSRTWG